ncbi:unnamed protein product, partial [Coregonus sp. 'balchen']
MSGAQEHKRRRPQNMYLVASDLKIQDQLEGTIRLLRGNLCQEQEGGRSRGDQLWVKVFDNACMVKTVKQLKIDKLYTPLVLDYGCMVKIDKQLLIEVPTDLTGLLEPISDPESRLKLLSNPKQLHRLAALPLGTPLYVQMGQPGELAEAELRYRGPLTRGSTAVLFGVQLKDSAVGRGNTNGSYKGHQLFTCPEASALFLPADQLRLRRRANDDHHNNVLPPQPQSPIGNIIARTAESAPGLAPVPVLAQNPSSRPPLQVGQRVCFPLEDTVHGGEVRFCGALPGRTATGVFDNAVGNWDGSYKGEKLCSIPSSLYGCLLPISKVSPEPRSRRHTPPLQNPKPVLKPTQPPAPKLAIVSSPASTPKIALMPPQLLSAKLALKPPPLPSPKPFTKPHPLPPTPPAFKPQTLPSPTSTDQPQLLNGSPSPLSPGRGEGLDAEENGDAGLEVELEVGSMVEVNDPPLFGVIRWIGRISGVPQLVSGIELDQELTAGTDGSYLGERHFRCPANKGLFVKLRNCRRDSRFPAPETPVNQVERCNSIDMYQGWKRGIQGHLNSCYLDASLFSLFSCCSSVDWVLLWPTDPSDGSRCSQAQDLLRCEIVNPLRRFGYVCASKTMALRRLLEAESSDTGFTNQEKDPEEFLNKLFQLLRVEPLLKIRSVTQKQQPQECHLYQLFPPSVPLSPSSPVPLSPSLSPIPLSSPVVLMRVASVQTLLETSFLHAGLKFAEVHIHKKRQSHNPCQVGVAGGPWTGPLHGTRQRLALFAVTCIETSHYVSFVKHGPRPDDWLFFDSMADREGGENGFNVPQVKACPEVGRYLSLSEEELGRLDPASLRESARRLLCDSYMCLYHSPELSLYK